MTSYQRGVSQAAETTVYKMLYSIRQHVREEHPEWGELTVGAKSFKIAVDFMDREVARIVQTEELGVDQRVKLVRTRMDRMKILKQWLRIFSETKLFPCPPQ